MLANLIRPPALRPGDVVRIVAPSGPVFADAFHAGLAVLGSRYDVRYDPSILQLPHGYLAAPDDERLAALIAAIMDRDARAVFMGRGGYGLLRIAAQLDRGLLRENPKPVVGFSDGTVLAAVTAVAGIASIHGPVVSQLARLPEEDHAALFALLESTEPRLLLDGLQVLRAGSASGPLLGGNLEVFSRLLGTPLLPDLQGAILFLEDVGERPYRIDRLLTHLELAGVFSAVAGVVVGEFIGCDEPAGSRVASPRVMDVVRERLSRFSVPVALGAPVGHGHRNVALPYGVRARLDVDAGTLTSLEAAVL